MRTKHDWKRYEREENELRNAGFLLHKFHAKHWVVSKQGSQSQVFIWPSSRKYMLKGGDTSHRYENIVEDVSSVYSRTRPREDEVNPTQKDAQKKLEEMRAFGLSYFKAYTKV